LFEFCQYFWNPVWILGAAPGNMTHIEGVKEEARNTMQLQSESRTPTPKMLLNAKDGTLHWPVYQV